jgi:hypothetical protein
MNRRYLVLPVLMLCGQSVSGMPQEERAIPVVTAAAPVEKIRFAASQSSAQMRIEVRSAGGALVFDSDWKNGNLLDWLPQDSFGQPLTRGVYRLLMQSKNLAGQTSEKQASLRVDSAGMAVDDQPSVSPKITVTAHDGETGQLIITSGDLSFRFGDFLNRKDAEVMRLTKEGNLGIGTDKPQAPLDVNGLIRTSEGIMFPDGTVLTSAAGLPGVLQNGATIPQRPGASRSLPFTVIGPFLSPPNSAAIRSPRPTAPIPDNQFKVDSAGVHIGTTYAFGLDVAGDVTLASNLALPSTTASSGLITLGGNRFAHNFGTQNTFIGTNAGNLTMTGANNTAIGNSALPVNTTGFSNMASGRITLNVNSTGSENTATGDGALETNTTGNSNTANGRGALGGNMTGCCNTGSGYQTLASNSTGSSNIAIGFDGGASLTTGNNNIEIGNQGVAGESDTIRIGTLVAQAPYFLGVHTRAFMAGVRGTTVGGDAVNVIIDSAGQLGTTIGVISALRYKFDVNSMGDATGGLMRLRPVTFRYLAQGDNAPLQYGLIGEEVAEVYPEMVTRNKDGEVETVTYQFLAPMLLNEAQKQHRQIEDQQKTIDDQQKTIDALNTTLAQLMQRVEQLEGQRAISR